MNILVFGGAGFLGSYVVDELLARGHDVTVFDTRPSPWAAARVRMITGDVMDEQAVQAAVQGCDVVYHFAGLADLNQSIDSPKQTISLNVIGTLNVLDACRMAGVSRFVYASSAYVFSKKGAFYGVSKKCSELIIEQYNEQYGLDYSIIRYGSVYGERADDANRIYRLLRDALTTGRIVFLGDGTEEREYIHGRDAAKLSVDILDERFKNQNIILTGNERFQYSRLLNMIKEMVGGDVSIEFLNEDYNGHYYITQYSFMPRVGIKLVNNPCVDFGQGLLECMEYLHRDLHEQPCEVIESAQTGA